MVKSDFPDGWFTSDDADEEPKEVCNGKMKNRISKTERLRRVDAALEAVEVIVVAVRTLGKGCDSTEHKRPLAPRPTEHLPGTPEKVAVMTWRCRMGYQLFHPSDATYASVQSHMTAV